MNFKCKEKMIIFFFLILWSLNLYAGSDTLIWSSPVNVSNNGHSVSSPQIVGDGKGNAVVIWVDNTTGYVWSAFSPAGVDGWIQQQAITNQTIQYSPSIAMNAAGEGIVSYSINTQNNNLFTKNFQIANGQINWGSPQQVAGQSADSSTVVGVDNSGNGYLTGIYGAGVFFVYRTGLNGTWEFQQIDAYIYGASAFNLAVNNSGIGNLIWCNSSGSAISAPINGPNYLTNQRDQIASAIYNGGITIGALTGTGQLGNSIAVLNTNGNLVKSTTPTGYSPISPSTWQIFFLPMGSVSWEPSITISNVNATAGSNMPALNVNQDGLGVLAYNLTTDNNVHAQFVNLPNQTVGRSLIVGQGTNPVIDTDSFGDAFAAWVNPNGYLNGAWLPIGASNWKSSSQISVQPIAAGTTPAITTLNTGNGAIVYAVANDIHCVFFTLENPSVIKQGVLINGLKYNNDRRQKGIQ